MSLGTVVHEITSDDGSFSFRATNQWEATEAANMGCEGAREVVPEEWVRRHPNVFTRGAKWRSWHEQTGECIWGGSLAENPARNDGRADIAGRGVGRRAERSAGRLIYYVEGTEGWGTGDNAIDANNHWRVEVSQGLIDFYRIKHTDSRDSQGVYATTFLPADDWNQDDAQFHRFKFHISHGGTTTSKATVELGPNTYTIDDSPASYDEDVDLTDAGVAGPYSFLSILVYDPAADFTNSLHIQFSGMELYGLAPTKDFSASAVVRDLCNRMRLSDLAVEDFGNNAMPLMLADGESFAEAYDEMALLVNGRWLILDNGTRAYMDFGRFNKRVWDAHDPRQPVDLLPLDRYDRVTVTWKVSGPGHQRSFRQFVSDDPFDTPSNYGRVRFNKILDSTTSNLVEPFGWRILDELYERRFGGSAQLADVLMDGELHSAFFVHAGDVLRVPRRRARARIARKSMRTNSVTFDFEDNYAPIDALLARRAKKMERA